MAKLSAKWVRVMADYCSTGIWTQTGASMSAKDLPVSEPLRERLEAWCRWYEQCLSTPAGHEQSLFDSTAFAAEGLSIAQAIKHELPDWTVVYFDEAKASECDYNSTNRTLYEFEI